GVYSTTPQAVPPSRTRGNSANACAVSLEGAAQQRAKAMAAKSRSDSAGSRRPKLKAKHSSGRTAPTDPSTTVMGVRISHPDRLIHPDLGMSKIEFARYFESIAD